MTQPETRTTSATGEDGLREQAVERLRARRDLGAHVLAFVLVHAFLTLIWWVSGAGFFWPVFPLFGWGIGLAFHAWDVYHPEPSEQRIQAEVDRLRRG
jgi:2TM domain